MSTFAVVIACVLSQTPTAGRATAGDSSPVWPDDAAHLPIVLIDRDNVEITESCRIQIVDGLFFPDPDDNGVIHVKADGVTLVWPTERPGRELMARADRLNYESMRGVGVRIDGHKDVTIRGAHVHCYRVAIWATNADGLTIDEADLGDGYAMRLGSTPAAEDSSDWLWPHANDNNEWANRYGAAVLVQRSSGVTIRGSYARWRQNGIILENVTDSRVYDCDFSFLSGWGLAMWRSSRNLISRNSFDFCIRGYSHGVYNRGQDSAGILMFEQCNENLLVENSATHGGDGVFAFGGKEALGETPAPECDADGRPWTYQRRGCNDNVFIGNDFSYAAAHGLELTFSFGNIIVNNRFEENAICGIWGGYSQDTLIQGNTFTRNGQAGYGLERGGVNIEHSERNTIAHNRFEGNAAGVHLWHDADPGLMSGTWAAANHERTRDNTIVSNMFTNDRVAIHLRAVENTRAGGNTFERVERTVLAEGTNPDGSSSQPMDVDVAGVASPDDAALARLGALAVGEHRPVGHRSAIAGRRHIIMDEYFPQDLRRPAIRRGADEGGAHVYEVYALAPGSDLKVAAEGASVRIESVPAGRHPSGGAQPVQVTEPSASTAGLPAHTRVIVEGTPGSDVSAYTLTIEGPFRRVYTGVIVNATWDVVVFESGVDPREDVERWRDRAVESLNAVRGTTNRLSLRYGNGGVDDLRPRLSTPERDGVTPFTPPGRDHFGTIATTSLRLPAGRWRVTTLSDDGVRVLVGGRTIIENWTWHGPTRDVGEFEVATPPAGGQPEPTTITVEHFELDGYAVLEVQIEPVR